METHVNDWERYSGNLSGRRDGGVDPVRFPEDLEPVATLQFGEASKLI